MNAASGPTGIDLVFFAAGGRIFAVESAKVRSLGEVGNVIAPVMADLLGLPARADPAPREWLLRLVHAHGTLAVRVNEPVVQDRLPVSALHPLPPLLEARLTLPGVRALVRWRESAGDAMLVVVLDPACFADGLGSA
ncbi:MAG TPA: hypothetical protein DCS21_00675 [Gammaproteobacteria bacterium]|nr:hypothetical protein [Gammaproteobacteria bacterium]